MKIMLQSTSARPSRSSSSNTKKSSTMTPLRIIHIATLLSRSNPAVLTAPSGSPSATTLVVVGWLAGVALGTSLLERTPNRPFPRFLVVVPPVDAVPVRPAPTVTGNAWQRCCCNGLASGVPAVCLQPCHQWLLFQAPSSGPVRN